LDKFSWFQDTKALQLLQKITETTPFIEMFEF
jgi:hypothetical protein